MLNTPMELSSTSDKANNSDLNETPEELEASTPVEDGEELGNTGDDQEQNEGDEEVFLIGKEEITESGLKELRKGQMLQSDYTRKRQAESAEHKQKMTDTVTAANSLIAQVDEHLAFLEEDEDAVEWDDLTTSEAKQVEKKFKARRKKLDDAKNGAVNAKASINQSTLAETNNSVFNHFSEWQGKEGDKTQKADLGNALKYAKSIGYTDEQINNLNNPQQFIAIIEASKYHAIKNAKPETKRNRQTPKTVASKKSAAGKKKSWDEVFYGN